MLPAFGEVKLYANDFLVCKRRNSKNTEYMKYGRATWLINSCANRSVVTYLSAKL